MVKFLVDNVSDEESDETLMLSYQNGNAAAFELLYERHKGGVFRYLLGKCRQQAVAEELFQDVWMKLIASRQSYEVRAKFTTYLYLLAHNQFVDYYRKNKRDVSQLKSNEESPDDVASTTEKSIEEQIDVEQQIEVLTDLIDALPEEQREAFILREEAGLSVAEIAEVTGVNNETAKSRLRYAVNKLKTSMKDLEPQDSGIREHG